MPTNAEHQKNRYHTLLNLAKEYLGNHCVECGSIENLEFDHIDPTTKLFVVSTGYKYASKRFWDEVDKCQLLCTDCHLKKTRKELHVRIPWNKGLGKPKPPPQYTRELVHGTRAGYLKETRRRMPHCDDCKAANTKYTQTLRAT